mgnify:CR=1 FL=1
MSSTIKVNNIQNLAGDDSGIDLSTNDQIILKTANTTALTIDSSQNVGIGESSPDNLLTLKGTAGTTHQRFKEASTNIGFIGGANGIISSHNGKMAVRAESGLVLSSQGNAADESFEHTIWLANPADTAIHKFVWGLGQGFRSEHAACQHRFFGCYDGGTGAITGMRFYMNSGNISSGTIQLYGIV